MVRVILSDETWDFPQVGFCWQLGKQLSSAWTLQQWQGGTGMDQGVSAKDILIKKDTTKLCPNAQHHNLSYARDWNPSDLGTGRESNTTIRIEPQINLLLSSQWTLIRCSGAKIRTIRNVHAMKGRIHALSLLLALYDPNVYPIEHMPNTVDSS